MQKTFTVDPISKRRLDNFGEEEKYYIANHHEPIISEEQFELAQKILRKRSKTLIMDEWINLVSNIILEFHFAINCH